MSMGATRGPADLTRARGLRVLRQTAIGAALAALTLTGCGVPSVLGRNTPAAGVNADRGAASARGLIIVANDQGKGVLTGMVISRSDDVLTQISGVAQTPSFGPAGELSVGEATIQTPANSLISLTQKKLSVSSPELKPGLTAEITFSFEKAGDLVVIVPVVDASNPDFATVAPS